MSTVRTVAKNTTALLTAEVVSQGLRIVYFAVLVRYIQAEGMGMISTAQALVTTLFVLLTFGFEQLMVRDIAGDRTRAVEYISNVGLNRMFLAVVFGAATWLSVQAFGYSDELALITYVYALGFLIKAFTDLGLAVYQAFEIMEYNLVIRVVRDVVNVSFSLLAIYLGYSILVIVAVSALANLVELVLTFVLLRRRGVPLQLRFKPRLAGRLLVAALPFALVSLYPLAHSQLSTLILSATDTVQNVGWFASANTLVGMLMLIPALFMRAMFPVFSRFSTRSGNSLQSAYQKSFTYLLVLGLATSVGTFLTAHELIPLVFGSGFDESVPILRILAWVPVVGFVGHVNGNLLVAMGREKTFMVTEGVFAAVYAGLGFLLVPLLGMTGAAISVLLPTVAGFVFYSVYCHRLLALPLPWKRIVLTGLAALLMAGCVYLALRWGINLFAIVLLIAPAVYAATLYLLGVLSHEDVSLLKQALKL